MGSALRKALAVNFRQVVLGRNWAARCGAGAEHTGTPIAVAKRGPHGLSRQSLAIPRKRTPVYSRWLWYSRREPASNLPTSVLAALPIPTQVNPERDRIGNRSPTFTPTEWRWPMSAPRVGNGEGLQAFRRRAAARRARQTEPQSRSRKTHVEPNISASFFDCSPQVRKPFSKSASCHLRKDCFSELGVQP